MVKTRTYYVTRSFQSRPKVSDFRVVEEDLPSLKNGEILVRAEFISVDPYLTFANSISNLPYEQESYQVGVVLQSKNTQFPVGTRVISYKGWKSHYIVNPEAPVDAIMKKIIKLPDLKGLPISYAIGAVGMIGATAYLGFLDTQPNPGETVVITGAAGAVGSIVGQIAKIKGCKVIGFAGSDDKVRWLEKDLGFDKAINYKKVDVQKALEQAAPKGVDIFFDNAGGDISGSIMQHINNGGRVCLCGSTSTYNSPGLANLTILQPSVVLNELEIKRFVIWNWNYTKWEAAHAELIKWIKNGQIKIREHITEGFEKLTQALVGMLAGENIGKAIVKISVPTEKEGKERKQRSCCSLFA